MPDSQRKWWIAKSAVFIAGLAPITLLIYWAFTNRLSANPIQDITNDTGLWTLRLIMLTLAITPSRRLAHWPSLIRFRRMIGLFAFFYAVLHFTTYIWMDQDFDLHSIAKDIPKRPFITAGFTAFVLLIPLAVTSTRKWIARLGGSRWQALHRLIYVSAIAGVIHYIWVVKLDTTNPYRYGLLLIVLLASRIKPRITRITRIETAPTNPNRRS